MIVTIDMPAAARGLAPGERTVDLVLHAEPGAAFSAGSLLSAAVEITRGAEVIALLEAHVSLTAVGGAVQPLAIPVHVAEPAEPEAAAELAVTLDYVTCAADDEDACAARRVHLAVAVRVLREGGVKRLSLPASLPAPTA